jgi:hypothetical protein
MLFRSLRVVDGPPDKEGHLPIQIQGLEPVPCHFCGGESNPTVCPRDGASHNHGFVHSPVGHIALCGAEACSALAKAMWTARADQKRAKRADEEET